jgi:hypothetical protein
MNIESIIIKYFIQIYVETAPVDLTIVGKML